MYVRENEMFDDMFNDYYEPVRFGDLTYDPAYVLRCCDPVAYQMAVQEYLDGLEEEEENGEEE